VTGERVRKRYLPSATERAAESRPCDGAAVPDAGASRPSENENCVETRCDVGTRGDVSERRRISCAAATTARAPARCPEKISPRLVGRISLLSRCTSAWDNPTSPQAKGRPSGPRPPNTKNNRENNRKFHRLSLISLVQPRRLHVEPRITRGGRPGRTNRRSRGIPRRLADQGGPHVDVADRLA
jgi:hypothetical protein